MYMDKILFAERIKSSRKGLYNNLPTLSQRKLEAEGGCGVVGFACSEQIAGWNISRAAVCDKIRKIVWERANRAVFGVYLDFLKITISVKSVSTVVRRRFLLHLRNFKKSPTRSKAA